MCLQSFIYWLSPHLKVASSTFRRKTFVKQHGVLPGDPLILLGAGCLIRFCVQPHSFARPKKTDEVPKPRRDLRDLGFQRVEQCKKKETQKNMRFSKGPFWTMSFKPVSVKLEVLWNKHEMITLITYFFARLHGKFRKIVVWFPEIFEHWTLSPSFCDTNSQLGYFTCYCRAPKLGHGWYKIWDPTWWGWS